MMKKLMLATLTLITAFTVQSSACAQADEKFYFPSKIMAKVESVRTSLISPYSAKEDIKEIGKAKLLVVHSAGDTSIPVSQGKLVFANATTTKSFWEYEGEHLEAPVKYPTAWVSKVNALLVD